MTGVDRWMLPEGVDELLPAQARVAERMRRDLLDLFASWGYQLVMPSLIEFTDSLLIGLGQDVDIQTFRLTDQISGKPMAVRADITPQAARIDAHSMQARDVNRLCYAGSVLHARPQALLASRCPIQVGAELYGDASSNADIEMMSLMLETLRAARIESLTLDLGHVDIVRTIMQVLRSRCPAFNDDRQAQLFDALQRKSIPDLQRLSSELQLDDQAQSVLLALPGLCGGVSVLVEARHVLLGDFAAALPAIDQLEQVASCLQSRFDGVDLYLDLAELRGYDYHTGLVFAAYTDGYGRALANGGRYDEIGEVFGAARPATGFNTDLKALVDLSEDQGVDGCADAIHAPQDNCETLWQAVCRLRRDGETVIYGDRQGQCTRQLVANGDQWDVVG